MTSVRNIIIGKGLVEIVVAINAVCQLRDKSHGGFSYGLGIAADGRDRLI